MTVLANVTEGITLITDTLMPSMIARVGEPPLSYLVAIMLVGAVFFMVKKALTRR